MNVSLRRFGLVVWTALAVFALVNAPAQAQRLPIGPVPNPGLNPNPAVNPVAAVHAFGNAAALGNGLVMSPFSGVGPLTFGGNYGPLGMIGTTGLGIVGTPGIGSLAASYANPALGYGSLLNGGGGLGLAGTLLNSAAAGYGYGYGYATYGTQWMMNPYQGYLSGAASVTDANANYWRTIANARLVRQQAIQESIRTRRAMIEEAEYERAHMPDPEKIRQRALERELDRARVSPPLTEIWSGRSLNALLRNAIAQQGQGARGPNVPISEDTLKSINPSAGDTRGNVGLLKDNGKLQWPQPLLGEAFKDARQDLSRHMKQAVSSVQVNSSPDESTLRDLQVDLKKLQSELDANISALSPDQYVEARRYLRLLGNTITALKDRNVVNLFNGSWALKGKNVAELVQFMRDKGLWFAPATPGDESAYTSLYYALAAFEAGLPRSMNTSSDSGDSDSGNKGRTNSGGGGGNGGTNPR